MTINEIQDKIIDDFSLFDDWMGRYNLLIDLGKDLPEFNPKHRIRDYLIEGCQSKVWLYPEFDGQKIKFSADSDALITKGIVALLVKVLSDRTPDEIISAELYFIDRIGLRQNLSPTRANGLLSMLRQMRLYAIAYKASGTRQSI